MHAAPAVTYPVGRPRLYTSVFVCLWAGVAVLLVAFARLPQLPWGPVLALVAGSGGSFALAWRSWRRCAIGRLSWDGLRWWWSAGGAGRDSSEDGRVQAVLDLQQLLLLRFVSAQTGRVRWLWMQRPSLPHAWDLLRCAVMQSAGGAAGQKAVAR